VSERSEFSSTPNKSLSFWRKGDKGAFFFGSVSFGQTKEMNALAAALSFNKNKQNQLRAKLAFKPVTPKALSMFIFCVAKKRTKKGQPMLALRVPCASQKRMNAMKLATLKHHSV